MAEGGDGTQRGRPLVGYAVSGTLIAFAVVVVVIAVLSAGGGEDSDGVVADGAANPRELAAEVLPDGGTFALPEEVDSVHEAARAASCELRSYAVESKDHVSNPDEYIPRSSRPPTSGRHAPVPAPDGAYAIPPDVDQLVHTLEHGRVIVWFDRDLPRSARASLKAFYDHDPYQLVLVPDTTDMPYAVAATAWHGKPKPLGRGRLFGSGAATDEIYTALEAFKERNRGRGPELIP
jgi:hypothetical protein